jgi:hypothetical protein
MGKTRSSAFVFAAAYIALIVGLFLALGGPAYAAQSPSSATDQYGGTQVQGVQVSATGGGASSARTSRSSEVHRTGTPSTRGFSSWTRWYASARSAPCATRANRIHANQLFGSLSTASR